MIDVGRPCAWCDTTIVTKRGGWKRPDRAARSRITRPQALVLHQAHLKGKSLREIARAVHVSLGYATDKSCLEGIRAAFDREGLPRRTQAAGTAKSNRDRAKRLPGESENEYKRRRRREHGYRCTRTGEWRVAAPTQEETIA